MTDADSKRAYWAVANSYVHAGKDKVTSLTVCYPIGGTGDSIQLTFSDKVNPIRVKLGLDEVAGLSKAVESNVDWKAYHTFKKEDTTMETRVAYSRGFINAERSGLKIALKLTEDEKASLELTLKSVFQLLVTRKCVG